MMPAELPRKLTTFDIATWAITLGCLGLLWSVGYSGLPVCISLFGICLFGGLFHLGRGMVAIRNPSRASSSVSLLVGFGTMFGIGIFAYQVLANEEGPIPISGEKSYSALNRYGLYPRKLRLFNLNVLHGYPDFHKQNERFFDTVAELKCHDPDLVVLQEVWTTSAHGNMAERLGGQLGFNYAYARANGSHYHIGFEEGIAILSRFPIVEAKRILLKPRQPWWENRIALMVKLQVADPGNITVVGVHLSNSDSADDQAQFLLEIMREHSPDIVTGDFNSLPESRAIKALVRHGFTEAIPRNQTALPWIDHVFLAPRIHERWPIKETSWIIATQPVPGVREAISDHDRILVDLSRH